MDTVYVIRLVVGLAMTVAALAVSGRRACWLYRLIRSGQPADDRTDQLGERLRAQLVEVFGQRKLLRWSVPGWRTSSRSGRFVILASVYLEAYGALFDPDFHIPLIGRWPVLGFLQDTIAVLALVSLGVFAVIRIRNAPERKARASRFYGSHTGGAWLILFMIFNVLWTMFLFRGASSALGVLPYTSGRVGVDRGRPPAVRRCRRGALEVLESVGLLLHIGVMLAFTIIIVYSKHLHIFLAPINVSAKRLPKALGPLEPIRARGQADRLRGPAGGRHVRPREGRGLHLEGDARLRHLHRVRPLPVAVPGVEHRQAAVAQARDHGPARPPVRQGALPHRRPGRAPEEGAIDFAATGATARPRSAGVRVRPGARVRAGAGRAPAGRARPRRAA